MNQNNLIILNDYGFINGGAAQVAVQTAILAARAGVKVYFFCAVPPFDAGLEKEENIEIICTNQADILSNNNRLEAIANGLWNTSAQKKFRQLLERLQPLNTVVHVHGWTKALSHSVILEAQKKRFPVVVTLHDYFVACPNGGFYNYQKGQICPLQALSPACVLTNCDSRNYAQKTWRVLRSVIQKQLAHIPSGIKDFICLSNTSAEVLKPYLPADSRIHLLPTPVDVSQGERVKAEKNTAIYGVGRLSPEKGFDLLTSACHAQRLPLVLVGDGGYKSTLERLNPSARFTGWLSHDLVMQELTHARTLVVPSRQYETQGLVTAEAAARGIPVVVAEGTAAAENVEHGITGLKFKINNLDDLSDKLRDLGDDALVEKMSRGAYDRFWANHPAQEEYFTKLTEIYANMKRD